MGHQGTEASRRLLLLQQVDGLPGFGGPGCFAGDGDEGVALLVGRDGLIGESGAVGGEEFGSLLHADAGCITGHFIDPARCLGKLLGVGDGVGEARIVEDAHVELVAGEDLRGFEDGSVVEILVARDGGAAVGEDELERGGVGLDEVLGPDLAGARGDAGVGGEADDGDGAGEDLGEAGPQMCADFAAAGFTADVEACGVDHAALGDGGEGVEGELVAIAAGDVVAGLGGADDDEAQFVGDGKERGVERGEVVDGVDPDEHARGCSRGKGLGEADEDGGRGEVAGAAVDVRVGGAHEALVEGVTVDGDPSRDEGLGERGDFARLVGDARVGPVAAVGGPAQREESEVFLLEARDAGLGGAKGVEVSGEVGAGGVAEDFDALGFVGEEEVDDAPARGVGRLVHAGGVHGALAEHEGFFFVQVVQDAREAVEHGGTGLPGVGEGVLEGDDGAVGGLDAEVEDVGGEGEGGQREVGSGDEGAKGIWHVGGVGRLG